MARIVYRGPKEGLLAAAPGGHEYAFERDVPRDVPDDFAERVMANNPEPWQVENNPGVFDVFELAEDKPLKKSKGGEG